MQIVKDLEELKRKWKYITYRDNEGTLMLVLWDSEKFFQIEKELELMYSENNLDYDDFYQKLKEKMTKDFDFIIL